MQVIDTLPAGLTLVSVTPGAPTCQGTSTITCNLGDLPVGQVKTVEIVVRPTIVGTAVNTVRATGGGADPKEAGSGPVEVLPPPTFEIQKEAPPAVLQNSTLQYTITVKNLGPGDARDVKINDPLPRGVTLVSVTPDPTFGMACTPTAPPEIPNIQVPVVCTVPILPELKVTKVVLVVRVTTLGPIGNTASVDSGNPSPGGARDGNTKTTPTVTTVGYAYPAPGAFVIGDRADSSVGKTVNFWGAQWDTSNPMSGGGASNSFKGFDNQVENPRCGGTWSTDPGNSSNPPGSIPEYMGVIVSSKVDKAGSDIAGDIKQIVIVKTDPGYGPNPGHAGTGTVVLAVPCQ